MRAALMALLLASCTCPPGQLACESGCTGASDVNNCGACGRRCRSGQVCRVDRCVAAEDTGDCLETCYAPFFCRDGRCTCPAALPNECGGTCVSMLNSVSNCGACRRRCAEGASCEDGECRCPATAPEICDGVCTEIRYNARHCGACGVDCGRLPCMNAACMCPEEDQILCDTRCVDRTTDPYNCGACGNVCELACVDGHCVTIGRLQAGGQTSCVQLEPGPLVCWGSNVHGQIGNLREGSEQEPVQVMPVGETDRLSVGGRHACAISGGRVWCWGENDAGKLGRGFSSYEEHIPAAIPGVDGAALVVAGMLDSTCALVDGVPYCVGAHADLFWASSPPDVLTPTRWGSLDDVSEIALGSFVCAQRADGRVYCSERGSYSSPWAEQPIPEWTGADQLEVGSAFGCARVGGEVSCFGENERGELGDGTLVDRWDVATPVLLPAPAYDLSVGWFFACAHLTTDEVYCWGSGQSQQLAQPDQEDRPTPVRVAALSGVLDLECGGAFCCAVTGPVEIRCWGANGNAQTGMPGGIGIFGEPRVPTPQRVPLEEAF